MRFNKNEMVTLALQPAHKFDKEGVLIIWERQDGFFKRSESTYSDDFVVRDLFSWVIRVIRTISYLCSV